MKGRPEPIMSAARPLVAAIRSMSIPKCSTRIRAEGFRLEVCVDVWFVASTAKVQYGNIFAHTPDYGDSRCLQVGG